MAGGPEFGLGPRLVELAQLAREKVSEHDVRGDELQGEVAGTRGRGIGPLDGVDGVPKDVGELDGLGTSLREAGDGGPGLCDGGNLVRLRAEIKLIVSTSSCVRRDRIFS